MKYWMIIASLTGLLCVAGCDSKGSSEKPQGVLTDAQKKTLEQAKKTEEILKEANEKRMKEVDAPADK